MNENFRKMREAAGLLQAEAAEKLGVNQSAVSMWEKGYCLPRAKLLPKVASLYGCTIDDLLRDTADAS